MGRRYPRGRGNFWGLSTPLKSTGNLFSNVHKNAEPIAMPFGRLTYVGPKKHALDGGRGQMNPFAAMKGVKMVMRPSITDVAIEFCIYIQL